MQKNISGNVLLRTFYFFSQNDYLGKEVKAQTSHQTSTFDEMFDGKIIKLNVECCTACWATDIKND